MTKEGKRRFSLAWLKPPPVPPDGNMSLFEHLRELRYRFVAAAVIIILGMVLCAFFWLQLYEILLYPYEVAKADLMAARPGAEITAVNIGVTAPMMLLVKVVAVAAVVLTSPGWLYQLWAFIAPGLLGKEKKWAVLFIATSAPLFVAGVGVGYWVMPKGISVMLGFTPENLEISNLLDLPYFLNFLIRLMLVFGIAFLLPVVVVALNLMGVVSAAQLAKSRLYVIFGTFVFGAVATPSTDPFSMLALALPMTLLFLVSELICRINDKRRAARVSKSDELEPVG